MQSYTLRFIDNRQRQIREVEFDAEDASAALIVAHGEALSSPAELWQGEKKLCTIRRDPVGDEDFWEISD